MLPGVSTFRYPYHIQALLNGESAGEQWLAAPGAFHLTFPLKLKDLVGMREANKASIVVKPQATFVGTTLGTSNDARALSILLDRISIVGDGTSTSRQNGKTNTATSKEN
jgi:hypothetical protein